MPNTTPTDWSHDLERAAYLQWNYALADVWAHLNCVWHLVVDLAEATAMLISGQLCLTPKFAHHERLYT